MNKILVVEDKRLLRLLYQEELAEDGYEVSTAANAEGALDQITRDNFDLVITDVRTPGKDGIVFIAEILGRRINCPIIIYTAYPCYRGDFMSWTADAYLIKSSCLLELKNTIHELLNRRAMKTAGPAGGVLRAGVALPSINAPASSEIFRNS